MAVIVEVVVGSPPWGWPDVWAGLISFVVVCVLAVAYIDNNTGRL